MRKRKLKFKDILFRCRLVAFIIYELLFFLVLFGDNLLYPGGFWFWEKQAYLEYSRGLR